METLIDIAQQLKDIADKLTQVSQNIIKTHSELGTQLQTSSHAQQPVSAETTPTSKQGE